MNKPRLSVREKRWNRFLPGDRVRISQTHWSNKKEREGTVLGLIYNGSINEKAFSHGNVGIRFDDFDDTASPIEQYNQILSIRCVFGEDAELIG